MINDLRTIRFIDNNENVIFLSTPGVGKTHLAIESSAYPFAFKIADTLFHLE